MNDRARLEEEIFSAATLIRDPVHLKAFLDACCADQPDLRQRMDDLLSAHREADPFFAEGAEVVRLSDTFARLKSRTRAAIGRTGPDVETIGARIGRYKLLEKIGEGGCGAVFLAEQEEPVLRHVALKIIRVGMETRSVIARFEAERQALAMMDHPNIARVFDGGATETGAPYFVMEHVRGVRVTEYCDQHRLNIAQRLQLFIQVCHAIQHAHQKGIIHGDIKPSNIMIAQHDGVPVPKVIDFGIARATEGRRGEATLSTSALWIGTPYYMSPEQIDLAGMDVDTRSDIYSLGVLLFELLTGRTPLHERFPANASIEQLRSVHESFVPEKPSSVLSHLDETTLQKVAAERSESAQGLLSAIRGDLDCILQKALQRERSLRYETANGLALDVQRHLNDEVVTAHRAGWFYSFRKLVRRNRALFLASGVVMATLLVALGVSTRLFLNERLARQRAVEAEQQQARLRLEAEFREQITQAALLVSQERFAEADGLIRDLEIEQSSVEGAAVYRAVGEWHAVNGRWKEAADRFSVLLEINELDSADVRTLDFLEMGPVLVELGDLRAYDRFRRQTIERFPPTGLFADRVVKISLLAPADDSLIATLAPYAALTTELAEAAYREEDAFQGAWRSMSMSVFEYRAGNYARALYWANRCLEQAESNAPRTVTAYAIKALALHHQGRHAEAKTALGDAQAVLESRWVARNYRGSPVHGFWFDWAYARLILREASADVVDRP